MKVLIAKNYEDMSGKASEHILNRIKAKPNIVLGLATGSTPTRLYQNLIKDHKENGTSYRQIITFNLDEYVGLSGDHPNSYRYFMDHELFNHIDIPKENTHIPNGLAENIEEECHKYEALIKKHGGIDVQILGIGQNGHIGFNEPGTPFSSRTHVIQLEESTRVANSRFFRSLSEVPTHAITMGIETILEAKEIILLASGKAKAEAMKRLFLEEPTEEFPASALKNHANVLVIVDEEALGDLDEKDLQKLNLI